MDLTEAHARVKSDLNRVSEELHQATWAAQQLETELGDLEQQERILAKLIKQFDQEARRNVQVSEAERANMDVGTWRSITRIDAVDRVLLIAQAPIPRTASLRSCRCGAALRTPTIS